MHFSIVLSLAAIFGTNVVSANVVAERSVLNGACTGSGGHQGVCVPTAKCHKAGGTYISNKCPGTPEDIKCCTKPSCNGNGNCRWTSSCGGETVSNKCPGPASFKCCLPSSGGGGGGSDSGSGTGGHGSYSTPHFPSVGACRQIAVDGAHKVVKGNPGAVRQIYCTRDCGCPGTSDHCCGKAIDFMCSSGGGVKTTSGRAIAEWVMHNRKALNLKYVIWGQKIWNPSRDKVEPWSGWRGMENRGSITANHWDHVHVSFN